MAEHDVFISYSSKDRDWVKSILLPVLENAGLKTYVDYRDFPPGMPTIKAIEQAVVTSRKTLAVLSPSYMASQWTELETTLLHTLDPSNINLTFNINLTLIPLLKAECDLPLRLQALGYLNFVDPVDQELEWSRLVRALGGDAQDPLPLRELSWPQENLERASALNSLGILRWLATLGRTRKIG